jgi:hypothetical protein
MEDVLAFGLELEEAGFSGRHETSLTDDGGLGHG